jgi:hypothetical protein
MSLSQLGNDDKKNHVNQGNGFVITTLSLANIIRFDKNCIKIRQDNKKVYDRDIEIILGYNGVILSEKSISGDNIQDDYDDENMYENVRNGYDHPRVDILDQSECECDRNALTVILKNISSDPDFNFHQTIKLSNYSTYNDYECCWENYKLSVYDAKLYIISDTDTGKILNVFYTPDSDLQMGDSYTQVYLLDHEHLLIYNAGDVYSVIIIQKV